MKRVMMVTAGAAASALLLAACSSGTSSSPESTTTPSTAATPNAEESPSNAGDAGGDTTGEDSVDDSAAAEPVEPDVVYPLATQVTVTDGFIGYRDVDRDPDPLTWGPLESGEPTPAVQMDSQTLVVFADGPVLWDEDLGVGYSQCEEPGLYSQSGYGPTVTVATDAGERTGRIISCLYGGLDKSASIIFFDDDAVAPGVVDTSIANYAQLPGDTTGMPDYVSLKDVQAAVDHERTLMDRGVAPGYTRVNFTFNEDCDGCEITAMTNRADSEKKKSNFKLSYTWPTEWKADNYAYIENNEGHMMVPTEATPGMVFMINAPQLNDEFSNSAIVMAPDYEQYGKQWPDACWAGTSDYEVTINVTIGEAKSGYPAAWDSSLPTPASGAGYQDTPVCVVTP